MAIGIDITGATTQQRQDIGDAFDALVPGRGSLTKAQWAERCVLEFIKNKVKGYKRQAHQAAIDATEAQVDSEFGA